MSLTIEELSQLMNDTYQAAAVKHGWYDETRVRLPWAYMPEEHRNVIRDVVATLESVIREDEQTKDSPEVMQEDLKQIMAALGINVYARSYSPHETVRSEILPKIYKIKRTLAEVKEVLDRVRNLI